jgi:hypothetical protein
MARLQILELPEGAADERAPFILVIDQVDEETAADIARWPDNSATRTGARHVLCFSETIDIPANQVPLGPDGYPIRLRVEGDFEQFREQVQDEILAAQAKVTQTLKGAGQTQGRQAIPQDAYRRAKRKSELQQALGMGPRSDWGDIRNAADGIRKERDAQAATIARVRAESARIRGVTRTWEPVADLIDAALDGAALNEVGEP